MKIQRTVLGEGIAGLTLTGEFDAFAANPFLEQIEAIVQSGSVNVVVNLRLVLFINSTAIGSLVKARKRARGLGGNLVLAEPSARVKDALDTLGLGQVIQSFASDDDAVQHLAETDDDGAVKVPSENSVLLKFAEDAKQRAFSRKGGVGRMASLDDNGIEFVVPGSAELFENDTEVKVKFRLPLFRRAYYFDVPCAIRSCEAEGDDFKVYAEFGDIFEEDRQAISQFVRDLRLLKDEIRSAENE